MQMREKGVKFQVTLTKEMNDYIEAELKRTLLSKSAWIMKLINEQIKKEVVQKKIINLKIEK